MERIEVSFEITKDLYIEWCQKPVSKNAKTKRLSFNLTQIFGIVLAAMITGASIWSENVLFSVLGGVFILLFCYRLFFRTKIVAAKYYKKMRAAQNTEKWMRTFVFEKHKIHITDANSTTTLKFSDIISVQQDENLVYLIQNSDYVYRLPKSAFVQGTPEELIEAFSK